MMKFACLPRQHLTKPTTVKADVKRPGEGEDVVYHVTKSIAYEP